MDDLDVIEMPTPDNIDPTEVVMDADWSGEMATRVRKAIDSSMRDSTRSRWASTNHIGISDIGTCREYVRRMMTGVPWTDEQDNYAAAFIGTAVGDFVERALLAADPESTVIQRKVVLSLKVRGYSLDLPGTADVILNRKAMIDAKTKDGLGVVRRSGPSLQQFFQVTLYAAALIDEGLLDEDAYVGLAYIDRSGREPDPFVYGWKFDRRLLDAAVEWIDDVIYAIENKEAASKDQPRQWCFACCPYASDCRGGDSDVTGLITTPEVIDAARVYAEANAAIKALEKDKESAKSALRDMSGSTGEYSVRWVSVPPTTIESYERSGYSKIDVRPIKRDSRRNDAQQ